MTAFVKTFAKFRAGAETRRKTLNPAEKHRHLTRWRVIRPAWNPMDYRQLETQIMNDEGFRARPYLDSVGVPTIGYGSTRIMGHPVTLDQPAISATNARQILRGDLYQALVDAQAVFSRFDEMDEVRQGVIANMAYNIGKHRLVGFKRMIKAADKLDYPRMAFEMQDSKWFSQVGLRSVRLVNEMHSGLISA